MTKRIIAVAFTAAIALGLAAAPAQAEVASKSVASKTVPGTSVTQLGWDWGGF